MVKLEYGQEVHVFVRMPAHIVGPDDEGLAPDPTDGGATALTYRVAPSLGLYGLRHYLPMQGLTDVPRERIMLEEPARVAHGQPEHFSPGEGVEADFLIRAEVRVVPPADSAPKYGLMVLDIPPAHLVALLTRGQPMSRGRFHKLK